MTTTNLICLLVGCLLLVGGARGVGRDGRRDLVQVFGGVILLLIGFTRLAAGL